MNDFVVTINDKKIPVVLSNEKKASVNGKDFIYNLEKLNRSTYILTTGNKRYLISSQKKNSSEYIISLQSKVFETKVLSALQEKAANLIESSGAANSITIIKSPMPGMILKVKKKSGDEVKKGDSLLILEAMKMENDIRSHVSGTIKEVKVKENEPVEKGAVLLIIE